MARDNRQKVKLLVLMEMLRQDSDEEHPLTTGEICRRLGEQGISCERRTVGKDMKVLREAGMVYGEKFGYHTHYLPRQEALDQLSEAFEDMRRQSAALDRDSRSCQCEFRDRGAEK